MLSAAITVTFLIMYRRMYNEAVDLDLKYKCIYAARNEANDLMNLLYLNWLFYLLLTIGSVMSCCGALYMCMRWVAGCYNMLPGFVIHVISIVMTGLYLYSEAGEYCATEGNGQAE